MFFNPFLTALIIRSRKLSELTDWMVGRMNRAASGISSFDVVVSGEMFGMSGGTAQFAAGCEREDASGIAPEINLPGLTVSKTEPGLSAPNLFER